MFARITFTWSLVSGEKIRREFWRRSKPKRPNGFAKKDSGIAKTLRGRKRAAGENFGMNAALLKPWITYSTGKAANCRITTGGKLLTKYSLDSAMRSEPGT